MRQREATVYAGGRYKLPSSSVVEVDAISRDMGFADCRYVGYDVARDSPTYGVRDQVALTLRFLQKFAFRVWT